MQAFDWSRVWEGNNILVELTRQERALLLQHASNVLNSPSTFLTGYDENTDLEEINDFLMFLQFHLLDNPPPSAGTVYPINILSRLASVNAGAYTKTNADFMTLRHVMQTSTNIFTLVTFPPMFFTPGDWHCRMFYAKSTDSGYWQISLAEIETGGVNEYELASALDLYGLFNAEFVFDADFEVLESNPLTLLLEQTGSKNASSSNYRGHFQSFHFWKT